MATITIKDLQQNCALDNRAMSAIKGAGAPWVFGWIRPFVETTARPGGFAPIVNLFQTNNLYQTNNFYVADQMNNQFQVIDIEATAANASIHVDARQLAGNFQ